jgi:5-histidylcysteine sulfoxide synthase
MASSITPLMSELTGESTREVLLRYFNESFDLYEDLFSLLRSDEILLEQPEPLRHPLIFYFGHTAVFYVNKLVLSGLMPQGIDARFEQLLATGVDEMSWDDVDKSHYDWPGTGELWDYRDKTREAVEDAIGRGRLDLPVTWGSNSWAILMGAEHERIHLETSSVLIRQLKLAEVRPSQHWPAAPTESTEPVVKSMIRIPGSLVTLGRSHPAPTYGWDNEFGKQAVMVGSFHASNHLVTNGEYLRFVEAQGYEDPRWWSEEGWNWRTYVSAELPPFWTSSSICDIPIMLRILSSEIELPHDWPVETNCLEAEAYCRWLSSTTGRQCRLPSEAEWQRMFDISMQGEHPGLWTETANINLEHFASPCAVNTFKHRDLCDVVGNVWQWTCTPIAPFAGFSVHPLYEEFSVPTFDGKHNLIKGGSWISTGNESHPRSRYAFRKHFYQHAGFRVVEPTLNG